MGVDDGYDVDTLVQVVPKKTRVAAPPASVLPLEVATAREIKTPMTSALKVETQAGQPPVENFRTQLTERYNWFLRHNGGLTGGGVAIYEVPNFSGDWSRVSPEDYYAYRLSVKGLRPEPGQDGVSLSQVAAELEQDKRIGIQRSDNLRAVLKTYYGVEDDSKLELNNFIPVNQARMRELVSNAENPAAGAFKYGEHVGVLLNAESTKDNREFSAEVAHEVGHAERMRSGKDDTDKDVKKVRLEEGIVQANARKVAEKGGFKEAKALAIYDYETTVASRLAERLGVDMMDFSHAEIAELMRLSPTLSRIASNPYQLLIDNLDRYVNAVREVDKAGDNIDPKRLNDLALQFRHAEEVVDRLLT